jgi:hypothetical protein
LKRRSTQRLFEQLRARNRVPQEVEDAVVALAVEQPAFGQGRIANEPRKRGLTVSRRRTLRLAASRRGDHEQTAQALEAKSGQESLEGGPWRIRERASGLLRCSGHLLVFDAAPQPLDEHVVAPRAFAVQADCNDLPASAPVKAYPVNCEPSCQAAVLSEGFFKRLDAERHLHGDRNTGRDSTRGLNQSSTNDQVEIRVVSNHRGLHPISHQA